MPAKKLKKKKRKQSKLGTTVKYDLAEQPRHPGGRPSQYSSELANTVDQYLASTQDVVIKTMFGTKTIAHLPTIEDFASYLDVSKATIYNWANEHEEFLDALEKILREQQRRLLNNGLSGSYNSTIAKLVLSANHGMREKTDVTTDGKEIVPARIIGMRIINESEATREDQNKIIDAEVEDGNRDGSQEVEQSLRIGTKLPNKKS